MNTGSIVAHAPQDEAPTTPNHVVSTIGEGGDTVPAVRVVNQSPAARAVDKEQAKRDFKGRVVPAYEAYLCCENAYLRGGQVLLGIADALEDAYEGITRESFAPNPMPLIRILTKPDVAPRVITLEMAAAGVAGAVVLGSVISDLIVPTTRPQLEAQARLLRVCTDVLTQRATRDCYACVKRKLLGQGRKRIWVKAVNRRRSYSDWKFIRVQS